MNIKQTYSKFNFVGDIAFFKNQNLRQTKKVSNGNVMDGVTFQLKGDGISSQIISINSFYKADGTQKFREIVVDENGKPKKDATGRQEYNYREWKDRLNPEIVAKTPNYAKIVVDLETDMELKEKYMNKVYESNRLRFNKDATPQDIAKADALMEEVNVMAVNRYEFLEEYDVVELLEKELPNIPDNLKLRMKGNVKPNRYKGKTQLNYDYKEIDLVPEKFNSGFTTNMTVYFDKESLDDSMEVDEEKVEVYGYIDGYDGFAKEGRLFPQTFVIKSPNVDGLDLADELKQKLKDKVAFNKSVFTSNFGEDIYRMEFDVSIFNGVEEVELDESDLTDFQRKGIESGAIDKTTITGRKATQNIRELRLVEPLGVGEYSEGAVETGYTVDDLPEILCLDEESKTSIDDMKVEPKAEIETPAQQDDVDLDETLKNMLS